MEQEQELRPGEGFLSSFPKVSSLARMADIGAAPEF